MTVRTSRPTGRSVTRYPLPAVTDARGERRWFTFPHDPGLERIVASVAGLLPVSFGIDVTPSPHLYDGPYLCQFSSLVADPSGTSVTGSGRFDVLFRGQPWPGSGDWSCARL